MWKLDCKFGAIEQKAAAHAEDVVRDMTLPFLLPG